MANLLTLLLVVLALSSIWCFNISIVAQKRTTTPCFEFFAYCKEPYNISRPNMWRIEGEKADLRPPQKIRDHFFRIHRCFCDANCHRYGDCCLDTLTDMSPSPTLEEFELDLMAKAEGLREWECHTLPMTETDVYMLGSCPPSFGDAILMNRCARRVPPSGYDYTLDLPVVSQQTNITYTNVYCSICNDDNQLYKWNILINCPVEHPNCTADTQEWVYVPGQHRWHYNSSRTGASLNITYTIQNISYETPYYQEFQARKCRKDIVRTCPIGWPSSKEKLLCKSYSLIVKVVNTSRLYKNEYCAICNGESPRHLLCPKTVFEPPLVSDKPTKGLHSYAVLLDFMGPGSQVGEAGACGTSGLVCGFGELCDSLHDQCRVYTCGRRYHMDDHGKCFPTNAIDGQSTNYTDLPYLDSDCPKFYVTRDRYVRYFNGSVYIKAIGKLYNSSQYEVVNSTTILVCTSHDSYVTWKFSLAQSMLSRVCITLSLFCLAAHIAIHASTPALLNIPGKNLLCLSSALFIAQLSFEFGVGVTSSYELCIGISLIIHFMFLATFLWMNVMAVDVFRTFGTATKSRSPGKVGDNWEFRAYSAYAWLLPLVLVLVAYTNDLAHWMPGFEPMYGTPLCWINNRQGLLIMFALPLAIILLANIVFFALTVNAICQTRKSTKLARKNSSTDSKDRTRMLLYIKLALIMGLTWVFGFVAALSNVEVMWYFFILLNCLQGAFIFIAFSCKKNVLQMVKKSRCGRVCDQRVKFNNTSDSHTRPSVHTIMTTISGKHSSQEIINKNEPANTKT